MKNLIVVILLLLVGAGVIFVGYKLYKRQGMIVYNNSVNYADNLQGYTTKTAGSGGTQADKNGLALDIISPKDGDTVNEAKVTIKGKTAAYADVSINEADVIADKEGNFSGTIELTEGENIIIIVTNDANGNYLEKELTLTLDSGV